MAISSKGKNWSFESDISGPEQSPGFVLHPCLPIVEKFDKTVFATHGASMANVSTKGRSH